MHVSSSKAGNVSVTTKTQVDKILEYPGARDAFDRLVKGGADPQTLKNLLRLRAIFADLPEQRHWFPARRSINSVGEKMKGLGAQIQELLRFPGIFDAIFGEAVPTITVYPGTDISFPPSHLSEILMVYAQILEKTSSKKRPKNASAGRNRALCRLVEYIKRVTGKKNYADLATLLNAVDSSTPSGDPRWDATSLAQRLYRERRRSRTPV